MNLGRSPLLIEQFPPRRPVDPRGQTHDVPRHGLRLGQSDAQDPPPSPRGLGEMPQGGTHSGGGLKYDLSDSTLRAMQRRQQTPVPSASGAGESGFGSDRSAEERTRRAESRRKARASALYKKRKDPRFPSKKHQDVHDMSAEDATKHLRGIWDTRHDEIEEHGKKRKRGLPATVPGLHHADETVRRSAWHMQAHKLANSMGDTHDRKAGTEPKDQAHAYVVRHRKTGAYSTTMKPRDWHATHDVVYTAKSESVLCRQPLLLEGVPQPKKDPRDPAAWKPKRVSSDESLRKRLATATPEVAARLRSSLKQRELLRKGAGSPSRVQRQAIRTKQSNYRGDKTAIMRPKGRKTEVALNRVQRGKSTDVFHTPHPTEKAKHGDRDEVKTGVHPAQRGIQKPQKIPLPPKGTKRSKSAGLEWTLSRAPLLQELVTSGGVFATGLNPGTRMVSTPPRDRRGLNDPKPKGGPTTTANTGHTANTGAWVPDKKKRKAGENLPDLSKIPKGRDGITRQLAAMQPSNSGGVMTQIARARTEQALHEACVCKNFWGLSANRSGNSLDKPQDDFVDRYRRWRMECPDHGSVAHESFCQRCDNSYPSEIGGADVLREQGVVTTNPFEKFPEPLEPREGPRVSPNFEGN